jgi:hypothetical protein
MVKSPYKILKNFKINKKNTVFCDVTTEQKSEFEIGSLGVAEAGRHLAILGSVTLAKLGSYKPPNYYLAKYADITAPKDFYSSDKNFHLYANVVSHSKRDGKIIGKILDTKGNLVYRGAVEYITINPAVFSRINKSHFIHQIDENRVNILNPYKNIRPLENITLKENGYSATFSNISPEDCLGHFENYPALPVAVLGKLLTELSLRYINNLTHSKNKVLRAEINSYKLAFHGDSLKITTKLIKSNHLINSMYSEVISINSGIKFADLLIDAVSKNIKEYV